MALIVRTLNLPLKTTLATRGNLFSVFRNPHKAIHLENKSPTHIWKSTGSALVIGEIASVMLVAAGVRCQRKPS